MFPSNTDTLLHKLTGGASALSATLILGVAVFLLKESWPVLHGSGWLSFVTSREWYPLDGEFGIWPMLVATLAVSTGALLIALPLGQACALYSNFYANPVTAQLFKRVLALMAGIPSVVYGFWGLTVLVPLIARWQAPGTSLLAAIIILAMMILPTIALVIQAGVAAVPKTYLHAAAALGLPTKSILLKVVIPAAKAEIFAAVLLAAARALGETMALLMVAGNVVQIPTTLFDPVRTLTANIALEMAYATGNHLASLFVSGLVLTLLVTLLAWCAHHLSNGRRHA